MEGKRSFGETIEKVRTDPVGLFLEGFSGEATQPASPELFKHLSPEEKAETLWALFQQARSFTSKGKKPSEAEQGKMARVVETLSVLYRDDETRETYLRESKRHLQEYASINGGRAKYAAIKSRVDIAEKMMDVSARELLGERGRKLDEFELVAFEAAKLDVEQSREELDELLFESRELAASAEYEMLRGWSNGLRENGFAWTPSRRKLLEEFETAALSGLPILAAGESGTGKTRMITVTAELLTGHPPNKTAGKDTRFEKEIAVRDIQGGEGLYEYGSIGEAATGKRTTRDVQSQHEGRFVLSEEFNTRPSADQAEILAHVESWKPGKKQTMPVTNRSETIQPKFLFVAAVNLASAKFSNREDIPLEVLRKFKIVDFRYLEQSEQNPELFDVMLAALMDENGRIRADKKELEPLYELTNPEQRVADGKRTTVQERKLVPEIETEIDVDGRKEKKMAGFLWRFANALGEINKSHERASTVLSAKGEGQFLGKLVIDVGRIVGWMGEYQRIRRNRPSLEVFVLEKIEDEFLSKDVYPKEDKALVKEFLAHFGIEQKEESETEEEKKTNISILTPLEIGLLSPRVRYEVITEVEPEIEEGFKIGPDGTRHEFWIRPGTRSDGIVLNPGVRVKDEEGGPDRIFRGIHKETGAFIYEPTPKVSRREPRPERVRGTSPEKAKEIFKEKYFGPDQLTEVFGVKLKAENIPPITMSEAELRKAESRGERLVLRIATLENGEPVTAKNIGALIKKKYAKAGKGEPVYALANSEHWENNDPVFTDEVPRVGWVLESVDLLPGSKGKNYIDQTKLLRDHAESLGLLTPADKKEASDAELDKLTALIKKDRDKNWKDVAKQLFDMAVNQKFRRRSSEIYYDLFLVAGDPALPAFARELENTRDWSSSRSADGRLVDVGDFDAEGVSGGRWGPGSAVDDVGVSFSRSV